MSYFLKRRCAAEAESKKLLESCHSAPYKGHLGGEKTARKVLKYGFFWPTLLKDVVNYVRSCDKCQRMGMISWRHEMPLKSILEEDIFDVRGIDFIGLFHLSDGKLYILVAIDYVSK